MGSRFDSRLSAAQRGYDSKWKRARAQFLADHPLCIWCSAQGRVVPAVVVDHIKRHGLAAAKEAGDAVAIAAAQKLFWDKSNWQALCGHCHDSHKQRLEKGGGVVGCDARGVPIDANHHWHSPR